MPINITFIQELEGNKLTGYVPDPENSKSGVTIACGFDLGQRSIDCLMGLTPDLIQKLEPYLQLKGQEAAKALEETPLSISKNDSKVINLLAHGEATDRLRRAYNQATAEDFDMLDEELATVIASVAYQYGDLARKTPNFWRQIIAKDYIAALNNLRNFGDRYPTRRNKEADLLEGWLIDKGLV